jgi:hypothetical protein
LLGRFDGTEELLAAGLVLVPPLFPPCSEAPLSLPQLLVYHVLMAELSLGFVQEVAHMVVSEPPEAVQTFWQKQDQAWREVLEPPLHCDWAWVRMEHDCPHDGRLPLPCVRSCAAAVEARSKEGKRLRRCIVLSELWNADGCTQIPGSRPKLQREATFVVANS